MIDSRAFAVPPALHDYAFATQRQHADVILGHWLDLDPRHGRADVDELDRRLQDRVMFGA